MNPDTLEIAQGLLKSYLPIVKKQPNVSLSLAVPAVFAEPLVKQAKDTIDIGMQNIHHEAGGAYTGDVSASQVASIGARFTIVGHSEERRALGETDALCNKKILAALSRNLSVILCVGESVRDEHGDYLETIKSQVVLALAEVASKDLKKITIAYEPVWAIGSNATGVATPVECLEVAILVRRTLSDLYGELVSKKAILLYGGSASSANANGFVQDGGVQGFLLGRASLSKTELESIIKNCA
jgi:triosephosphate isomerase